MKHKIAFGRFDKLLFGEECSGEPVFVDGNAFVDVMIYRNVVHKDVGIRSASYAPKVEGYIVEDEEGGETSCATLKEARDVARDVVERLLGRTGK